MNQASRPPTPTERGVETTDDVVLHTLRWGPGEGQDATGDAFVLIHGLASNAWMWSGVGVRLAEAGHVVVALDQRGHGRSTRPGGTFTPTTLARDLISVLDAHDLRRPVLVGQSWGGNVALDTAHRYRNRVSAVVAIDGGVIDLRATFPDIGAALDALRPPPLAGTPYVEIESAIRERHADWPEPGIQGALANFDLRDDGTVEPRLQLEEHLAILRELWEQSPKEWFADLALPVLLLMVPSDEEEGWTAAKRRQVEAAERAGDRVTARWLDGYEHDVHAQAPDVVVREILDWLPEAEA